MHWRKGLDQFFQRDSNVESAVYVDLQLRFVAAGGKKACDGHQLPLIQIKSVPGVDIPEREFTIYLPRSGGSVKFTTSFFVTNLVFSGITPLFQRKKQ